MTAIYTTSHITLSYLTTPKTTFLVEPALQLHQAAFPNFLLFNLAHPRVVHPSLCFSPVIPNEEELQTT
jgi:hypothetical protein